MLIGARTGAWSSGAKLPYDAEVEYLESTGVQYIDTGVDISSYDTIKVDATVIAFLSRAGIFGSDGWLSSFVTNNSNELRWLPSFDKMSVARIWYIGKRLNCFFTRNGMTINGVSYVLSGDAGNTGSGNFMLFKGRNICSNVRIYSFSIDEKLNLIPVRKDGVGFMYDKVSGELFGNAGTGAFIIGPDK